MKDKKTLFAILGRSASGKSTITNKAAEKLGMKALKSYTTRQMREGETEENSDHIFIKPEDADKYRDDMCAYTERVGYESFATFSQLRESDFYIIDPVGLYELILKTKNMGIEIVPIYITVPYRTNIERAKKRGDFDTWKENYEKENAQFKDFEKSNMIRYRLLNDCDVDTAVEKMIHIINRYKEENHETS